MAKKREKGWPPPPEPLPLAVVDNHTHLLSAADLVPDGERLPTASEEIAWARAVGVTRLVQVACDLDAIEPSLALAREHAEVVLAVALHPNEAVLHAGVREVAADGLEPDPQPRHEVPLDEALDAVARAATDPRVRAIGETGLDHFRGGERGQAVQREAFRAHVALAKERGLPLQIHDRDAHEEVVAVLLADGAPERTVFHCFSGDVALARTCAEHGWYLSIAGPVTFRANDEGRAAVAAVPLELLLTETDAPYLTPHPYRGRPNGPYLLPHTVRQIAEVRGESLERVCAVTSSTSEALYGPW
ncbi:MAG TPA: hydrolase TatD [Micrococcales bacterium]|uniref:TatD family hydrolase n=1 Tax=Miniimonas arenae TaxID=676201 RepID=UPI000ECB4E89|nr:TatD family hydrolase [Miniimonas arenae]HCX84351.1 hydrolase TatD [Micrococcales bacterium]